LFQFNQDKSNWKIPFFIIWSGQAFSLLGSSLVQFALVWWMTEKTGSAAVLATGAFISFLPQVILGPFTGSLVDRWDRRKIMIYADAAIAVATLLLAVLFWLDFIQLWHVFTLLFIRSLGGTFHWATMQASTSLMVPENQLSRVAGMNQTLQGLVTLAAPPLGALLMATLPIYSILSIDIGTALLAITPLLFILIPQPHKLEKSTAISFKEILLDTKVGFRYVYRWRGLFYVLLIAAVINFLTAPISTYLPLLVTQHFKGGIWQVGWTETAWGVGVIAGGIGLSVWGGFKKRIITSLTGLFGLAAGILVIAIAPQSAFWMVLVGMGITGIANPIVNGPFMAIIQSNVEADMQGRVFSVTMSLCGAMMPLSMIVSAPIVERLGPQSWYMVSAVVCFIMVLAASFNKDMRNLEEDHQKNNLKNASVMVTSPAD